MFLMWFVKKDFSPFLHMNHLFAHFRFFACNHILFTCAILGHINGDNYNVVLFFFVFCIRSHNWCNHMWKAYEHQWNVCDFSVQITYEFMSALICMSQCFGPVLLHQSVEHGFVSLQGQSSIKQSPLGWRDRGRETGTRL